MRIAEHIEEALPVAFTGQYLSADEVGTLAALMRELRELTQSRRTFAAASEFLQRLTAEAYQPNLVHDTLEY